MIRGVGPTDSPRLTGRGSCLVQPRGSPTDSHGWTTDGYSGSSTIDRIFYSLGSVLQTPKKNKSIINLTKQIEASGIGKVFNEEVSRIIGD